MALSKEVADLQTALTAAAARSVAADNTFTAEIAALTAKVQAGASLSPEDAAALLALIPVATGIEPGTVPPVPPTPAPPA